MHTSESEPLLLRPIESTDEDEEKGLSAPSTPSSRSGSHQTSLLSSRDLDTISSKSPLLGYHKSLKKKKRERKGKKNHIYESYLEKLESKVPLVVSEVLDLLS